MAVYLTSNNTDDIHGFHRLSPNLSISISSVPRTEKTEEDDHRLEFEDTVRLDSPLIDDQDGNIDHDTEVVDELVWDDRLKNDGEFDHEHEEIVLDSEDEEINGSRLVIVTKSNPDCAVETKLNEGNGVILKDFRHEKYQAECDDKLESLNGNISLGETEEWSQSDALGFVDRFVSSNQVELSQEISYWKAFRKRSPIASGANGLRILARKINNNTRVKGNESFEWVEREEIVPSWKGISSDFEFGGFVQKGVRNLNAEIRVDLGNSEQVFLGHSVKNVDEGKGVYEARAVNELELTGKCPEADDTVPDSFDSYDVGFDTQLAAEAIEALAYERPVGRSSFDACPEMDNEADKTLSVVAENDTTSARKSVCVDRGDTMGNATRKKRSERNNGRLVSSSSKWRCGNQELDHELTEKGLVQTSKLNDKTRLCCGISNDLNEGSGANLIKPFEKTYYRKLKKSSMEISKNEVSPLTATETSPLSNGQAEQATLPVKIEPSVIVYRRKRSRVNANPLRVSTNSGSPELCGLIEESRKSDFVSLPKLSVWNYPRGKRTRRSAQIDLNITCDMNAPQSSSRRKEGQGSITSTNPMGLGCTSLTLCAEKNRTTTENSKYDTFGSKVRQSAGSSIYKNHKRAHNKNEPKTPLLKELLSLGFSEQISEFKWKELRKRKDISSVRILFSQHLDEDIIKHLTKVATRLDISIVSCSMDATHFVADKFARTKNMLEAIALGKPVVTPMWLESCGQANCFIDERNYILRDSKKEREFGFFMPVSLARANHRPLLKGQKVFVTPNIKPNKEMIVNLVKTIHGQLAEIARTSALKDEDIPEDLLIFSCKEDHSICLPFLQKGIAVYSSELLLNGIVTQKLEYKRYQLFKLDVNRVCS